MQSLWGEAFSVKCSSVTLKGRNVGFSSYQEIQQWLEQTCQLQVEYGTLYRVVRYELKAKLKVPRPRALQQDPKKLNAFKKNCLNPQRDAGIGKTGETGTLLVPR